MARSSGGTRRLLALLEARFGSIESLIEPPEAHRIITGERRLEPGMLQELVSHRAAAIHIRGFYPEAASHALAERLLARDRQNQADDALAGDGSWKVGG